MARSAHQTTRVEVRLAPAAEQAIERAMAITGLDAGDLACQAARRVLDPTEEPETRGMRRPWPEFRF